MHTRAKIPAWVPVNFPTSAASDKVSRSDAESCGAADPVEHAQSISVRRMIMQGSGIIV